MDALEAILGRVSALSLGEPGPTAVQIDLILQAAVAAPDHGRLCPWRFSIIEADRRAILARSFVEAKKQADPLASAAVLKQEGAKAFRAPMIIAVAAHIATQTKIPDWEQMLAVGAAVQNMFLAAHAHGLGAMWKTGAVTDDPILKQDLGFELDDRIVAFLYLGKPMGMPQRPNRDYRTSLRSPVNPGGTPER